MKTAPQAPFQKNVKDFCRHSLYRAVKDSYNEIAATIALDQTGGKSFTWHIANLHKMLAALLDGAGTIVVSHCSLIEAV